MRSPFHRFLVWTARCSLVLLAVGLWSCTSEPISGIEDFEFRFDDEFEPDIPLELDTASVAIEYTPIEEDTTYLQRQDVFLESAQTAQQTGEVPDELTQVAEDVEEAFDEETETQLDALGDEAETDPENFAADLEASLEDSTSAEAQFASQVEDAAAQQQMLSALLGLPPSSGKTSFRIAEPGSALPTPQMDGSPLEFSAPLLDVMDCNDDAQAAFELALAQLQARRDAQFGVVEAVYEADLAKVNAFVASENASLERTRERRRADAVGYYTRLAQLIASYSNAGLISDETARSLRRANLVVLTSRLKSIADYTRTARRQIDRSADQSRQQAENRRASERARIETAFENARTQAQARLQELLLRCHDQGEAQG